MAHEPIAQRSQRVMRRGLQPQLDVIRIAALGEHRQKAGSRDDACPVLRDHRAKPILIQHDREQLVRQLGRRRSRQRIHDARHRISKTRAVLHLGFDEVDDPPEEAFVVGSDVPRRRFRECDVERILEQDGTQSLVKLDDADRRGGVVSQQLGKLIESQERTLR